MVSDNLAMPSVAIVIMLDLHDYDLTKFYLSNKNHLLAFMNSVYSVEVCILIQVVCSLPSSISPVGLCVDGIKGRMCNMFSSIITTCFQVLIYNLSCIMSVITDTIPCSIHHCVPFFLCGLIISVTITLGGICLYFLLHEKTMDGCV
jgi:hypothetical protein